MKITLEFKNQLEHDRYCETWAKQRESVEHVDVGFGKTIDDFTRRKSWSELEMQFLKDHYASKKIKWIAKQLRRKTVNVQAKLQELYRKGLPKKHPRNGDVEES